MYANNRVQATTGTLDGCPFTGQCLGHEGTTTISNAPLILQRRQSRRERSILDELERIIEDLDAAAARRVTVAIANEQSWRALVRRCSGRTPAIALPRIELQLAGEPRPCPRPRARGARLGIRNYARRPC